jgi:biopolymer transport protein ExbD
MAAKVGGGPKGKYELGQNSDINVTPFVDVMLVLLIVMMVAVPVATLAIKVDLPPAQESKEKPKPPTFISIRQDGSMVVQNPDRGAQPTDLAHLAGTLNLNFNVPNPTEQTVLIRADRAVRYSDFMAVVNQLQADGYYKVALITEDTRGAA